MMINGVEIDIAPGANLGWADLRGAASIIDLGCPHGYQIYVVSHDDGVRIKAGCRWLTYEEAVEYWRVQGDRKPFSTPLLAYVEKCVGIKGWRL